MHIKPKKSLGQNFLRDRNIIAKIISSSGISAADTVLEIGSGRGDLTKAIAAVGARVVALELDPQLYVYLKDEFKDMPDVKILHQDILKFNLDKYFAGAKPGIKVVANIPYYITSPIIEHLFKYRNKISAIYLTVQKEFGLRIIAPSGSRVYGAFSCFAQFYTIPRIIFDIKRGSFFPVPKVDSCFLEMKIRPKLACKKEEEAALFKIIRLAFNQRRKTLRNSLKSLFSPAQLNAFFTDSGISINTRPECLDLAKFIKLAALKKSQKKG